MSGLDREDEIALIQDIIEGLEAALEEKGVDLGNNEDDEFRKARDIRVNKLVHRAIEKFNLPILWSWYRYGQSVARRHVMGWNVTPGPIEEPTEAKTHIWPTAKSPSRYKEFFIEEIRIAEVCDKGLNEFLEEVYSDAPQEPQNYRKLYLDNLVIQETLDHMYTTDEWLEEPDTFYNEVWEDTLSFQNGVLEEESLDDTTARVVSRYVRLFRNAVQAMTNQTELEDAHIDAIKSLAESYHNHVWKTVAIQISSNTVSGPSEHYWSEEWREETEEIATNAEQALETLERQLRNANLIPDLQDQQDLSDNEFTSIIRDIESALLV